LITAPEVPPNVALNDAPASPTASGRVHEVSSTNHIGLVLAITPSRRPPYAPQICVEFGCAWRKADPPRWSAVATIAGESTTPEGNGARSAMSDEHVVPLARRTAEEVPSDTETRSRPFDTFFSPNTQNAAVPVEAVDAVAGIPTLEGSPLGQTIVQFTIERRLERLVTGCRIAVEVATPTPKTGYHGPPDAELAPC
jgi:hypothetical protein